MLPLNISIFKPFGTNCGITLQEDRLYQSTFPAAMCIHIYFIANLPALDIVLKKKIC